MKKKAIFFDLDGTLADTLFDIARAVNKALEEIGLPLSYDPLTVKTFIGRGADHLLRMALGSYNDEEHFQTIKGRYMPLYKEYQLDHIKPYEGMTDLLKELKKDYSLFVVSNKPDALAKLAIAKCFPSTFIEVIGAVEGYPKKPDPYWLNYLISKYGLDKKECLYVGDSLPDIELSHRGGLEVALVTWGYGVYDEDLLKKANYLIKKPLELVNYL